MFRLLLAASVAAVVVADTYCNYQPTGLEVTTESIPIAGFRTSGMDFVRPEWCLAACNSRTSIKGSMKFKPSNSSSPTFNIRQRITEEHKVKIDVLDKETGMYKPLQTDDDNTFCVDPAIAAMVDAVFDKYSDTTTITEALNYFINRPGWAYLVYQFGPPPSLGESNNVKQDNDFCLKTMFKTDSKGNQLMWNVFAGMTYN